MIFDAAAHARPNTLDFKPPLPNPLIQHVFQLMLPWMCNGVFQGLSIDLDKTSLGKLEAIQGERCLILPNHPSEWDPTVMFDVARQLKENFFFVAAREVFDYSYGLRGWFFQRLGVYSLVRGSNDRKSLKTSIDVLAQNKGRLVIFVEGEISNQNETLLPLESGVIQLAFMALQDLYKSGNKNLETLPSLYIVPASLRYIYQRQGLGLALDNALTRLEKAVHANSRNNKIASNRFERVQALSGHILTNAALYSGYALQNDIPMAQNVTGLSDYLLLKLEQLINLPADTTLSYLDRVRRLRNTADKLMAQATEEELGLYQKRLFGHQKAFLKNIHQHLDRVVNFVSIYDGYLQPDMDEHRYVEIIRRFEKEVFGAYQLAHPRAAKVTIHDPIDLKLHFPRFLEDKKAVVEELTRAIEQLIYDGIQTSGCYRNSSKTEHSEQDSQRHSLL